MGRCYKVPQDALRAEEGIAAAKEKLAEAEEGYKDCQDAEMPFLTGVEVLPEEENEEALTACQNAITTTGKAVNEGKQLVGLRLREAKLFEKDT